MIMKIKKVSKKKLVKEVEDGFEENIVAEKKRQMQRINLYNRSFCEG